MIGKRGQRVERKAGRKPPRLVAGSVAALAGGSAAAGWMLLGAAPSSLHQRTAAETAALVFAVEPAALAAAGGFAPDAQGGLASLDVLGREEGTGRLLVRAVPSLAKLFVQNESLFDSSASDLVSRWEARLGVDDYLTPDEVRTRLAQIADEHPDIVRLEEFGQSHEGRPLVAAVLQRGSGDSRPTVLFNGMHHARELMTTEVALSIVEELVAEAGRSVEVDAWLDRYRIVVVPQVNPDGNALVHSGNRYWRKNAWTESGGSKVTGVDLNRNYPALWGACNGSSGKRSSDTYRGPSAASEPETQALMELVGRYRPVLDISYHSFSELIIFPYGCRGQENQAREVFEEVAGLVNDGVVNDRGQSGRYEVGTAPELLYNADGSDLDWQWDTYGVLAFTLEINSSSQGFQPDYGRWRDKTVANQKGGWKALIRRLDGPSLLARVLLSEGALEDWDLSGGVGDEVYYTLSVVAGEDHIKNGWVAFATDQWGRNKRFPLRDRQGLIHHPLKPGPYRLVVGRGEELLYQSDILVSPQQGQSERKPLIIDLR